MQNPESFSAKVWTPESAGAQVAAVRDLAKSAHQAAEALLRLGPELREIHTARRDVLVAMRHLRRAFRALGGKESSTAAMAGEPITIQ